MTGRFGLVVINNNNFWEIQSKSRIHRKKEVIFLKELIEFDGCKLYLVWCCMFKKIGHKDPLPIYALTFNNDNNEIEEIKIYHPHHFSKSVELLLEEFQNYDYEKDINKNQIRIIRVKK